MLEKIKKHKVAIIVILLALIAIWYFFLRNKGTESSFDKNLEILGDENKFGALNMNMASAGVTSKVPAAALDCRRGTCPCTRTDGSTWCSDACCKKAGATSSTRTA